MNLSNGMRKADERFSAATTPPDGTWTGVLIGKGWGRECLLCYWQSGKHVYRTTAFRDRKNTSLYSAKDGLVNLKDDIEGMTFTNVIGTNSEGRPAWVSCVPADSSLAIVDAVEVTK